MVYKDCKIYGPYINKKDNRYRCILVHLNGNKQTISYPKYLMEVHLGRYLEENETIHHIDGNPLNNDISNLKILDRKEHCYNDALKNKEIKVKCSYCGKEFTIKGKYVHRRNRKDRNSSGYFCSKRCSGKYGKLIQLGLIKPTIVDKIVPNKYKGKSAQEETFEVEVG
jgi:endogenous inhibitor of DNA gyrase (YacG/DUF329 family)